LDFLTWTPNLTLKLLTKQPNTLLRAWRVFPTKHCCIEDEKCNLPLPFYLPFSKEVFYLQSFFSIRLNREISKLLQRNFIWIVSKGERCCSVWLNILHGPKQFSVHIGAKNISFSWFQSRQRKTTKAWKGHLPSAFLPYHHFLWNCLCRYYFKPSFPERYKCQCSLNLRIKFR
jgi:hypothetical protein